MPPDSSNQSPTAPVTSGSSRRSKKSLFFVLVAIAVVIAVGASLFSWKAANDRTAQAAAAASVVITDDGLVPATIQLSDGQTVTWANESNHSHHLVADQAELEGFDIELAPGDSVSYTFEDSGTFTFHDSLYPDTFKGTVIVD